MNIPQWSSGNLHQEPRLTTTLTWTIKPTWLYEIEFTATFKNWQWNGSGRLFVVQCVISSSWGQIMSDQSIVGGFWWVRMQTQAEGCQVSLLMSLGVGEDEAFLGHKFSSLQTVMCPLQFSSTNKMNSLNQIPELHIFNSLGDRYRDEGSGWMVQGRILCIDAFFVQNFLIEYKNWWWIVWNSSFHRQRIGQDWLRSCGDNERFYETQEHFQGLRLSAFKQSFSLQIVIWLSCSY